MCKLSFTLPWPPSINNYYGTNRKGRKYLLPKARAYPWLALDALLKQKIPRKKIPNKINVIRYLYPPDDRVRDEDNYTKALNDALTKCGIIKDDSKKHIKTAKNIWCDKQKPGKVTIELEIL